MRSDAARHHLSHQLHICYSVVEGSQEKYSVMGRSSHPYVFCKKGVAKKFCNTHRKIPVLDYLLNKVECRLQPAFL